MFSFEKPSKKKCLHCNSTLKKQVYYSSAPEIVVCKYPDFDIYTSHSILLKVDNNINKELYLRGIVYNKDNYFTSRIITRDKDIWYYDEITTGKSCIYEEKLNQTCNLNKYNSKNLVLAIYAKN